LGLSVAIVGGISAAVLFFVNGDVQITIITDLGHAASKSVNVTL